MDSASCSLRMCCGEVRTCLSGSDSQTGVSLFRPIGTGIDVAHWGRKGGLGSQSCWEIADCGSKQVWPNTRCLELSYYIDAYSLCGCMPSHFSCVWLFVTIWTVSCRLLCPWDSPGKNTGVDCHALLQGIFPTQVRNLSPLCLPHLGSFFITSTTWEVHSPPY